MRACEETVGRARAGRVLAALAAAGMAVCVGCGGGGDKSTETSGDPEADRRADLRVGGGEDEAKDDRTLYARLGGEATLTAIVEDMTARVIADPRVNFERKNVKRNWLGDMYKAWPPTPENVEQFKRRMVEFLTLAAGGSTQYTGRDLKVAHEGMKITNSEFDAMVGDIKTSMDKLGTRTREKRELLAIIETTRKQIVEEQ